MKYIYAIYIFIIFVGCSLEATEIKDKVVAFAQDDLANDYRKAQVFDVKRYLEKDPNIEFVYSDAQAQTSLLIRHLEHYIDQNVDVLIVGTNDAKAVVPIIAKAYKKGMAVLILDRGIEGDEYSAFIHSDNYKIGTIGAEYIAKKLDGNGTVMLLEGLQAADVTLLRSKGFMDAIAQYKDIKVIKRTGNYLRRDAIAVTEKLLADKIHIDAIFSESDSMLSGVRSALIHNQIDPASIIMIGCDYTSEAQKAINDGLQTGSVRFPLGGEETAKVIIDFLAGKKLPKEILIPVELVTKENSLTTQPVF